MSYEEEFRKKVLKIKSKRGLTIEETANLFEIGKSTVQRWLQRVKSLKSTGRPRKLCLDALKNDVETYPDGYQYERAKRLCVGQNAIFHGLKKLGISYKKKPYTPESRRDKTYSIPKED